MQQQWIPDQNAVVGQADPVVGEKLEGPQEVVVKGRGGGFVHGIARIEANAIDAKTPPQVEDYQRAQRVEILALKRLLFTAFLASEQLLQGQ